MKSRTCQLKMNKQGDKGTLIPLNSLYETKINLAIIVNDIGV